MTLEDLQQEVFRIVAEQLSIDESSIKLDSNFKTDLGADSLDTVEMIMNLEDHFNIEIEDDDAEQEQDEIEDRLKPGADQQQGQGRKDEGNHVKHRQWSSNDAQ